MLSALKQLEPSFLAGRGRSSPSCRGPEWRGQWREALDLATAATVVRCPVPGAGPGFATLGEERGERRLRLRIMVSSGSFRHHRCGPDGHAVVAEIASDR